jgi:hypothetical protein
MLPTALEPLAAWPQFVVWRLEWNAERSKWDKIPYSPRYGYKAASTKPEDWGTYAEARAYCDAHGFNGVGFVFTERDPFFFLDADSALVNGAWSQLSQELVARLPGAAVEVSQSGTGLHIIGSYAGPAPDHSNKNIPLHIELYTKERFVALTGTHAHGSVSARLDGQVSAIAAQYFPPKAATRGLEWTTEPHPEWKGPEDDGELIERAFAASNRGAANVFGAGGPSFADLFMSNAVALSARWPAQHPGGDFDHSEADIALANQLAFWTGKNCERIERIMRLSALARDKWDTHHTYLQNTILKSIAFVRNVYQERTRETPATPPPPPIERQSLEDAGFTPRDGTPLMFYAAQLEHFAGCTYVTSINRVISSNGDRLDKARFDVLYGGYAFILTTDGSKTTASAWEAFTENQAFRPPIADRLCFRPERGSGGIVHEAGLRLANIYRTPEIDSVEGDPEPFFDLMRRQLPVARDRALLLHWMASTVQNPGMKAQWWPILQGGEGNGKSYYLLIMSHAVGPHYAHLPNTDKMIRNGMNFNGWVEGKRFLGLEEVYANNRREFFEGFKTTVTNPRIPIEGKGLEETTGDNRANGIITTNHQDGVPISGKNRRYAAFFMAQQSLEDSIRDGLTDEYFLRFKQWMFGTGPWAEYGENYGFRVVTHYLQTMPLTAELDPAQLCIRAPETSSTQAAIRAGLGKAEQEIIEAIEEERPGFAGGWISSVFVERLLSEKRMNIAPSKRRELMNSIGYDYHPALRDGRVNNVIAPDNTKPRLYCKLGSIAFQNINDAATAARTYSEAQVKASSDKSTANQVFNK